MEAKNTDIITMRKGLSQLELTPLLKELIEDDNLVEKVFEKFKSKIDWSELCKTPLSEPFMKKYQAKLDWGKIAQYQQLSEEFISEFQQLSINSPNTFYPSKEWKDKLDWLLVSRYQKLSEPFIERFKSKVDWGFISKHQKLSVPFIKKYFGRVNLVLLSENPDITKDMLVEVLST